MCEKARDVATLLVQKLNYLFTSFQDHRNEKPQCPFWALSLPRDIAEKGVLKSCSGYLVTIIFLLSTILLLTDKVY